MDKKTKRLSSAEFAALCGVPKSTLRFYRDTGLLPPAEIRENGYGKYEPLQGLTLARIRFLESCDIGLREIRDIEHRDFYEFPYDKIMAGLEAERRSLAAKTAMLSLARQISFAAAKEELPRLAHPGKKSFLFLAYQRPAADIEYNLIHSMKLLSNLYAGYFGFAPFLLGRIIKKEDLLAGRFQKVYGLIVPVPEEFTAAANIPPENLVISEETDSARICFNGRPYAYEESYNKIYRYIQDNSLEICGDGLELWTVTDSGSQGTYAMLIDIPVRLPPK